jgi:molybdopterin-guanine dinucleotide biosynthesis adapter protein
MSLFDESQFHSLEEKEKLALEVIYTRVKLNYKRFNPDSNSLEIKDSHVQKLSISYMTMKEIIPEIYEFRHLKELYLYCNDLEVMPNIDHFNFLEKLALGGNIIKKIIAIPKENSLKYLGLGRNKIEKIEGLENAKFLQTLHLSSNKITAISGLNSVKILESLDLSNNLIQEIIGISQLNLLTELNLEHNRIQQIAGLENLLELTELYLAHNFIKTVEGLGNLSKLDIISLEGNQIDFDNMEDEDLTKLTSKYWVKYCQIQEDNIFASIPVISFIGYSQSGKTTSIESFIEYFKTQGVKTYVFKKIHRDNFTIDTPGKNTWRYAQAGADVVVSQGNEESAIIFKWQLDLGTIVKFVRQIALDENRVTPMETPVIILEGFRDVGLNLILCAKKIDEIKEQLSPAVKIITGAITSNDLEFERARRDFDIPILNAQQNPQELLEILDINEDYEENENSETI